MQDQLVPEKKRSTEGPRKHIPSPDPMVSTWERYAGNQQPDPLACSSGAKTPHQWVELNSTSFPSVSSSLKLDQAQIWSSKHEDPYLEIHLGDRPGKPLSKGSPHIWVTPAPGSPLEKAASHPSFHSAGGKRNGGFVPALPPGVVSQKTHGLQMFPLDPNAVRSCHLCYDNSHFPMSIHSLLPLLRSMNTSML